MICPTQFPPSAKVGPGPKMIQFSGKLRQQHLSLKLSPVPSARYYSTTKSGIPTYFTIFALKNKNSFIAFFMDRANFFKTAADITPTKTRQFIFNHHHIMSILKCFSNYSNHRGNCF